jgi:hypothetical protein
VTGLGAEFLRALIPVLVILIPSLIWWFLRDRRKAGAESQVAEGTVKAKVRFEDAGSLQATMVYVEEAFRVERESKDRAIAGLKEEVGVLRQELAAERATNADLRGQVDLLRETLAEVTTQLGLKPPHTDVKDHQR